MQAYLDGQEITLHEPTLSGAVQAAAAAARSLGRVIVEIRGDGREIADESATLDSGFSKVECVSAAPAAIVSSTLAHAADALADTRALQLEAAEQLQLGDQTQAFARLTPVLETWAAVQSAVSNSAQLLGASAGNELNPLIASLSASLTQLKQAVAAGDWSSAADTLAYELDGQCEEWIAALRALAAKIGTARM